MYFLVYIFIENNISKAIRKLSIIIIFISLTFLQTSISAQKKTSGLVTVYINEFLASNVWTNPNLDYGEYTDWIELYNDGEYAVDIGGYYLTDDLSQHQKWRIPYDIYIESHGYLVFWADGKNEHQHTNFKLSRGGEEIAFSDPNGIVMDSIVFNEQLKDVSYGRYPDGQPTWEYFSEPTPSGSNITIPSSSSQRAEKVVFSKDGGFYNSPIQIQLFTNSPNNTIRYTLDGSIPTHSSAIYSGPIPINSTTVISARTYADGLLPGEVGNHTYFVNENTELPIISISTDPKNFWDDNIGFYTVGTNGIFERGIKANYWQDWERPVHVEYFDYRMPAFKLDAGIAVNGARRNMLPKSMRLFARKEYGAKEINYKLFDDKSIAHFKSIVLRNGGYPEFQHTLFKDGLLQSILKDQTDIDYQSYKPVILYVNGKYWGIYNLREKQNEDYLASNYGVDPDSVDILEFNGNVIEGDSLHYADLLNFIDDNDISDDLNYEYVKTQMDVDEYIDYQIAEIYYANTDWPRNNIKFWRPQTEFGKWRWMIFDVDVSFGLWASYDFNSLKYATDNSSPNWNNPPWSTFLLRSLLKNEEFKNEFIQRFEAHMNSTFRYSRVNDFLIQFQSRIQPDIQKHIDRWAFNCSPLNPETADGCTFSSVSEWQDNINVIKEFALKRSHYMEQFINEKFFLSGNCSLNIHPNIDDAGNFYIEGVQLQNENLEGKYFKGIPIHMEVKPRVGYRFVKWEGISNSTSGQITIVLTDSSDINAVFESTGQSILPVLISENTTLFEEGSPYIASENITVNPGAKLTIEHGVEILFSDSVSLFVKGEIDFNGASDNPITLKPYYENGANRWGSIIVENAICRMSYVRIEGASHGPHTINHKAAVSGLQSLLSMNYIHFNDVLLPIFVQYGNTEIKNSYIQTDVIGDLINVKHGSAIVENCVLKGSLSPDTDGIDFDDVENGVIKGNKIYNMLGENCDGIDLGERSQNINIEDNIIMDCFDKGISVGQASTASVKNNIITNCAMAIGIKDSNSHAEIDHNTFYNNNYSLACFEKKAGRGGGSADVDNSIFSNSNIAAVLVDNKSSAVIRYTLSDTDPIPGEGNINGDPQFVNSSILNFNLAGNSPCINTGDPASPADPDGSRTDMGARIDKGNENHTIQNIVINEINYNSSQEHNTGDWVELFNNTPFNIDISNWIFRDEKDNHSFVIPGGVIIDSKSFKIISADTLAIKSFGDVENVIENQMDFGFSSSGELLRLFDNLGQIIDSVRYGNADPWPSSPNGGGHSLELINPSLDNSLAVNWDSSLSFGTPGYINSTFLVNFAPHTPIPEEFKLYQNYPNPFNSSTAIQFDIPEKISVKLELFDILGRKVITLFNNEVEPGLKIVRLDAAKLASGVYFYTLTAGERFFSKKLVLLK